MANKVTVLEISNNAFSLAGSILQKQVESITGVAKEGEEWTVLAEVLERRAIPDTQDIIGKYELKLAEDGELLGYKRVELRRRGDVGVEEE